MGVSTGQRKTFIMLQNYRLVEIEILIRSIKGSTLFDGGTYGSVYEKGLSGHPPRGRISSLDLVKGVWPCQQTRSYVLGYYVKRNMNGLRILYLRRVKNVKK